MPELVQATPEELLGFARKCDERQNDAYAAIASAKAAVDRVAAMWSGDFAKQFAQSWGEWQKDMSEFILEMRSTSAEMQDLAAIYQQADDEAAAALKGVAPTTGGGSSG